MSSSVVCSAGTSGEPGCLAAVTRVAGCCVPSEANLSAARLTLQTGTEQKALHQGHEHGNLTLETDGCLFL